MRKRVGLLAIVIILSSFAWAGLSLNEPLSVYNLGDRLHVSANGVVGQESGNFKVDLVCWNKTINFVNIPARAFSPEPSAYNLPYKILNNDDLEIDDFENIIGSCQLIASIGPNAVSSKNFRITDEVTVNARLDKSSFEPGEGITLKVDAIKANGQPLNGFVEVTDATIFSKAIENGAMTNTFSMSETIEAGTYFLNITAYDVGTKGRLNSGSMLVSYQIIQVPKSLAIILSDNEALPGKPFKIGAEIFDQSGKELVGSVSGKLISPSGAEEDVVFTAGDFYEKEFPTNAELGIWRIRLFYDRIGQEKEIEMKELQKIEMSIEDSILIIKNIGNTVYNKTISVKIGEEAKNLDLKIEIGETRRFNLAAPKGEYNVIAGDGESEIKHSVMLTGKAISIHDIEEGGLFKSYIFLWIFLIFIFGGTGLVLVRKYRKTKTFEGEQKEQKTGILKRIKSRLRRKSKGYSPISPLAKKGVVDLTAGKISSAESTLVLKGQKYPSAVISISIKNLDKLKPITKESLTKAIEQAKDAKGLIDWKEDHIFIIFSTIFSKTYNNEMLAAKTAFNIWKSLKELNNKISDKIDFNIGVNSGDLIASKQGEKLQYTAIGNTISLAKRISDSDSGKMLVSENIRNKGIRDLRSEKTQSIGEHQVYSVLDIRDREANQEKLKDILKRM
jgi:hypothetical protein